MLGEKTADEGLEGRKVRMLPGEQKVEKGMKRTKCGRLGKKKTKEGM
jgi:hypothetical protein